MSAKAKAVEQSRSGHERTGISGGVFDAHQPSAGARRNDGDEKV